MGGNSLGRRASDGSANLQFFYRNNDSNTVVSWSNQGSREMTTAQSYISQPASCGFHQNPNGFNVHPLGHDGDSSHVFEDLAETNAVAR